MDALRWERIEALCEEAMDMRDASRAAFLEQACGDDVELRHEVEALLEQLDRQPSFLERPIIDLGPLAPNEVDDQPATGNIGPYRLVRRLGRGGMGEVYLAIREVEDIQQSVALKIIRRGMHTDEVLQRFRLERRILGNLIHPNIARLLDASATDDGRPYFVMEYVEGVPLTEYCDRNRLSIRDRLALFRVICAAVQHAHQNLVVHRDLKPKNILVTADGAPKLLDFGIGKVLSPNDVFGSAIETSTDVRLLTPEYAAPEQVTGSAVTTATDVYALGVLLYEILAGHHPYATGKASRHEIERAVLESTPNRPSVMVSRVSDAITPAEVSQRRGTDPGHLRRRLAGDLDNIVLMALRKEPERRYASASAFADDIRRHLEGLPVSARADTLGYRARKFVRRHVAAVATTVIAFLALGVTTGVTMVQSRRVAREAARVEQERDKAVEVQGFLLEMFGATGADRSLGETVTARRLLDLQAAQLRTAYADRPELRAEMMGVLADGYDRLGLYKDAEPLAREALTLRRQLLGDGHPDVATALNLAGWITHELGRPKDAEPMLIEAAAIRRSSGERYRADLARSLNDLGVIYNALTRYAAAESVLTESLGLRRALHGDRHRAVGITASNLAAAFYYQGKVDSAMTTQSLALSSLEASVGRDHSRTLIALGNLAAFWRAKGELKATEDTYRDLYERHQRLQGPDHPQTTQTGISLGISIFDRAVGDRDSAALGEAETLFRRVLESSERTLGTEHLRVGLALHRVAGVELERGRFRDALATQQRAVRIISASEGDGSQNTILAIARLAIIRFRMGNRDEGVRLQGQAATSAERVLGAAHRETGRLKGTLCDLMVVRGGRLEDASQACLDADRALRGNAGAANLALLVRLRLAQAYLSLGRRPAADSILAASRADAGNGTLPPLQRHLLDSLSTVIAATR
jgi:eukaryotic-like serine/threonine-protein kinase